MGSPLFKFLTVLSTKELRNWKLSIKVKQCLPSVSLNWHCRVVVIITAQLHSTIPELRLCTSSNPARCMSEIDWLWWGSMTMILAGNKTKRLSSVNHTTKTNHYQFGIIISPLKAFKFAIINFIICFYTQT